MVKRFLIVSGILMGCLQASFAQLNMTGDPVDGEQVHKRNARTQEVTTFKEPVVVNSVPSPTSGVGELAYDGENIWVSGYDLGYVYKVSPADGTVLDSVPTVIERPYGLAFDGTHLWISDSENGEIQKLDTSDGTILNTIAARSNYYYPQGLAWDGTDLWNNDSKDNIGSTEGDSTFKLTTNGNVIRGYQAKGDYPVGLTFDGTYLWSSDNVDEAIHKIDTNGFCSIDTLKAPGGGYPNGLAYDGQYLWVANNASDSLHQVDISNTIDTATIGFNVSNYCPGEQIGFEGTKGYGSYTWKFGDGTTDTFRETQHTYDSGGTYQVKLIAQGLCRKDTVVRELQLKNASKPDFDFNVSCLGDSTHFTDLSSLTPESWSWDFDNGDTSQKQNPSVLYDTAGTHPVTLAVQDNGCRRTITKGVTVMDQPSAAFTKSANGLAVQFQETTDFGSDFTWEFGDSISSSEANPKHEYDSEGSYDVCLTVSNKCGKGSSCKTIQVENTALTSGKSVENALRLYPNPADNKVQIQLKGQNAPVADMQVLNTMGQVVNLNTSLPNKLNGKETLNIENLQSGIYYLQITTSSGENFTRKFVVE